MPCQHCKQNAGRERRSSDNRKNLMRLLDDCRAGRVTLVYTKSISRFARNTVDVLTIVRELKKVDVPVYFVNEQLYSFDKEAELAISLHGAIAQGEYENKSENRISMYQSSYGT